MNNMNLWGQINGEGVLILSKSEEQLWLNNLPSKTSALS